MFLKFLKIFIIIVCNFFLFLVLAETYCFCSDVLYNAKVNHPNWQKASIIEKSSYLKHNYKYSWLEHKNFDETYQMIKEEGLRKPIGLDYKKKPILLMGCSFAWGYDLDEKDTLGFKLSKQTQRPLYNRAYQFWWGLQTMYYQSLLEDFYKEVPEPEYVIYVFMDDHAGRALSSVIEPFYQYPHLRYVINKDKLEREKFAFVYNLFFFKKIARIIANRHYDENHLRIINKFFIETKKEFDKHWKNYKFVILLYDTGESSDNIVNGAKIKELNEQGFIVLSTKDLLGRYLNQKEDVIWDDCHPSAKVWTELTPKIIKRLNIN